MLIPIFRSKTYAKIKSLLPTVTDNRNSVELYDNDQNVYNQISDNKKSY